MKHLPLLATARDASPRLMEEASGSHGKRTAVVSHSIYLVFAWAKVGL